MKLTYSKKTNKRIEEKNKRKIIAQNQRKPKTKHLWEIVEDGVKKSETEIKSR